LFWSKFSITSREIFWLLLDKISTHPSFHSEVIPFRCASHQLPADFPWVYSYSVGKTTQLPAARKRSPTSNFSNCSRHFEYCLNNYESYIGSLQYFHMKWFDVLMMGKLGKTGGFIEWNFLHFYTLESISHDQSADFSSSAMFTFRGAIDSYWEPWRC
jgi:hypothetical protein